CAPSGVLQAQPEKCGCRQYSGGAGSAKHCESTFFRGAVQPLPQAWSLWHMHRHRARSVVSRSSLKAPLFPSSHLFRVRARRSSLYDVVPQISMAKMYRPSPKVNHSHQHVSSSTIDLCFLRNTAAVKIQTLVRMYQAHQRAVRRQEVVVWRCPRVKSMRKRLTFRAYTCLIVFTASVAWINLCYVVLYDGPAIRNWIAATGITVLVDIV
ncbi:unnamed protein product, partial [Ectocarpus sp. 13 AM-2016]